MPDHFVEDPNGLLYSFNGQDPVHYWDGRYPAFRQSGVTAPTAAIAITGSGSGSIIGRFYARIRYVDDLGNYSNVSPISDVYEATSSPVEISDVAF